MAETGYHILVVEDEPDGQEVVRLVLQTEGCTTEITGDAETALRRIFAGATFDALVLDLALPGMDGFEMLRALRANPITAGLPIVAVTAFHTPELRVKARNAGFNGYFPKPIDVGQFGGELRRIIADA